MLSRFPFLEHNLPSLFRKSFLLRSFGPAATLRLEYMEHMLLEHGCMGVHIDLWWDEVNLSQRSHVAVFGIQLLEVVWFHCSLLEGNNASKTQVNTGGGMISGGDGGINCRAHPSFTTLWRPGLREANVVNSAALPTCMRPCISRSLLKLLKSGWQPQIVLMNKVLKTFGFGIQWPSLISSNRCIRVMPCHQLAMSRAALPVWGA